MRTTLAIWLVIGAVSARAEVSALDSDGRRLSLTAPAQRIVSLAPHVTELLFAAGAGAKVVAVSEYSDFPDAAKALPRVASSGGIDLERVLTLRPDLAVAWRLEATSRTLDRLQSLGIPLFYSEPHRLAEIPSAIEALGVLAGTEAQAQAQAARLRAELQQLQAAYRDRRPIDVFYQISERPLMTLNGRHFVSDALALCGARNVFASAPIIAPAVSIEQVLVSDPEAIIAARVDTADRSWQNTWLKFASLRAVRQGNLLAVRGEEMHRHGPRAILATRRLCGLLDEVRSKSVKAANPP